MGAHCATYETAGEDAAEANEIIGYAYAKEGKLDEAEALLRRALSMREEALGSEDREVAPSLNHLASIYIELGRRAEAEPFYERALRHTQRLSEPHHR